MIKTIKQIREELEKGCEVKYCGKKQLCKNCQKLLLYHDLLVEKFKTIIITDEYLELDDVDRLLEQLEGKK